MKKHPSKAAYNWEETGTRGRVAVTMVTDEARQIAARVTGQSSRRQAVFWMGRAQFRIFQREFKKICRHPSKSMYYWLVDWTIYGGCCACGTVMGEKTLPQNPKKIRKESHVGPKTISDESPTIGE